MVQLPSFTWSEGFCTHSAPIVFDSHSDSVTVLQTRAALQGQIGVLADRRPYSSRSASAVACTMQARVQGVYRSVIDELIGGVKHDFLEAGIDEYVPGLPGSCDLSQTRQRHLNAGCLPVELSWMSSESRGRPSSASLAPSRPRHSPSKPGQEICVSATVLSCRLLCLGPT